MLFVSRVRAGDSLSVQQFPGPELACRQRTNVRSLSSMGRTAARQPAGAAGRYLLPDRDLRDGQKNC